MIHTEVREILPYILFMKKALITPVLSYCDGIKKAKRKYSSLKEGVQLSAIHCIHNLGIKTGMLEEGLSRI